MTHKVLLEAETEAKMADLLRQALRRFDRNPLATWRWWSGFLWGLIFMAACDFTDVHLCVGECDEAGLELAP